MGNLAKLRYLIKAAEKTSRVIYLRLAFGIIEVSSSALSIGLSLMENGKNTDMVNKIRGYLFWAEICTLSADVLSSQILSRQAKEARESLDAYRKTVKNKKQLEAIDAFGKHLDEILAVELFSKIVGKPINAKLLKKLQKEFAEIGGELKFDEESFTYIASREKVIGEGIEAITFNEELIFLNRNASTSAVYEELIHAEQFRTGKYNDWVTKHGNEAAGYIMEKEAAEDLLKNASKWKIPKEEIESIKERLEFFKKELKRLKI